VAFCHSLLDFSQQLPIYCGLKVGMSCNDMDAFESHLAFSRRAVRGQFAIQFMLCALQFQFLAAVYLWFQDLVAWLQWSPPSMKVKKTPLTNLRL
jgi:hypothetical protein